jgi:hypothetical protein
MIQSLGAAMQKETIADGDAEGNGIVIVVATNCCRSAEQQFQHRLAEVNILCLFHG